MISFLFLFVLLGATGVCGEQLLGFYWGDAEHINQKAAEYVERPTQSYIRVCSDATL